MSFSSFCEICRCETYSLAGSFIHHFRKINIFYTSREWELQKILNSGLNNVTDLTVVNSLLFYRSIHYTLYTQNIVLFLCLLYTYIEKLHLSLSPLLSHSSNVAYMYNTKIEWNGIFHVFMPRKGRYF